MACSRQLRFGLHGQQRQSHEQQSVRSLTLEPYFTSLQDNNCLLKLTSRFFITLAPCEHLNGKHTIFGQVVAGHQVLEELAKLRTDKNDCPEEAVIITKCGELVRQKNIPKSSAPQSAIEEYSADDARTGRKRQRRSSTSPSTSRSSSSHSLITRQDSQSNKKQHRRSSGTPQDIDDLRKHHRRRSDHKIDETRRGRERHMSFNIPLDEDSETPNAKALRRRSPSPSRGQWPQRSGSDDGHRRRPSLPNQYRRSNGKFDNYFREDDRRRNNDKYRDPTDRQAGHGAYDTNGTYGMYHRSGEEDSRLGGGGSHGEDANQVQLKGRGMMKYSERGQAGQRGYGRL